MKNILYLYPGAFGVTSYLCSRGPDGEFLLFIKLFTVIFLIYSGALLLFRVRSLRAPLAHFVVAMFVGGAGMSISPHLDEMGGMLYVIIPTALCAGFVTTCIQVSVQKAIWKSVSNQPYMDSPRSTTRN
jgi:hypothetical protein